MTTRMKNWVRALAPAAAVALVLTSFAATPVAAQVVGGTLRPYWHVFIAYGIAWIAVVVWIFQIARRLGRMTGDGS